MMGATSALPQNGHLPGMGGGREALAADDHGVDVRKIVKLRFDKKKKKREVTWNFGESLPR
jgi:hypothetical protein